MFYLIILELNELRIVRALPGEPEGQTRLDHPEGRQKKMDGDPWIVPGGVL